MSYFINLINFLSGVFTSSPMVRVATFVRTPRTMSWFIAVVALWLCCQLWGSFFDWKEHFEK